MASKRLDLDSLLDSKQKIYVRNNSLKLNLMIVMEIKDRNGRGRPLKIAPTELPICLTDMYSREVLRESADLRMLLGKGNIVLVDADDAESYLSTSQAKEEMKMLKLSVYADTAPPSAMRDSLSKLNKKSKKVAVVGKDLTQQNADTANVRVQAIIGSYKSKEKNSKETLTNITKMRSILTETDLRYILEECSQDAQIKAFAEAAMAALQANPEAPFSS